MGEAMLRAARPRRGRGDRRGADRACHALEGRRLCFVGIGGAGLSAYAQLARAWGAEVAGWDQAAHAATSTPLDGDPGRASSEAPVAARRASRSSSRPPTRRSPGTVARGVPGRARRRCAARSSSAGTHGKGTTAAMIAFGLREAGADPAWLIGAPVPQLGRERRRGGGLARRRGRRVRPHRLRAARRRSR